MNERYKELKTIYEDELGKRISDRTWRRRISEIKQFSEGFNVLSRDASQTVRLYAAIKKRCGFTLGKGKEHCKRMKAFNYFYSMDSKVNLTGEQFVNLLSDFMKVDVKTIPQSNFYYWFSRGNLQFNLKQTYGVKELSMIAYIASLWAINKHNQTVKTANPNATKLVK